MASVSEAMMQALGPEKVYVCSFGELVRHVHWYLIPRYQEMSARGPDVLNEMFAEPSPWACSDEDAAEVAASVKKALTSPR